MWTPEDLPRPTGPRFTRQRAPFRQSLVRHAILPMISRPLPALPPFPPTSPPRQRPRKGRQDYRIAKRAPASKDPSKDLIPIGQILQSISPFDVVITTTTTPATPSEPGDVPVPKGDSHVTSSANTSKPKPKTNPNSNVVPNTKSNESDSAIPFWAIRTKDQALCPRHLAMKRAKFLRKVRLTQEQGAQDAAARELNLFFAREAVDASVHRIVHGFSDEDRQEMRQAYYAKRLPQDQTRRCARCMANLQVQRGYEFGEWNFGLPGAGGVRTGNWLDELD